VSVIQAIGRNLCGLMTSRFLLNMTNFPEMIRNVAVVGHLHHGKTALMDMLIFETHKLVWDADQPVCGTAVRILENANSHIDRHGTLTLTFFHVNGIYRLSHHRCPSFYQRRLGNHTWYISSTHRDMSISLTRLPRACGWLMALSWL
jgi:hypothetical protein